MTLHSVLVRDPRIPAGGYETWVETLARGLPRLGVAVTVLVPGDPSSVASRLGEARIISIDASGDVREQAAHVLTALERLAAAGGAGVFFAMSYPYVNVAGLNLRGSPWVAVPVLHGRHASNYEWIAAGPPRRIVVPSKEYASVIRRELRRRARWFRALGRVVVIPHGVHVPKIDEKLARAVRMPLEVVAVTRLDQDAKRPFDYIRIAQRARERGVRLRMTIAGSGPAEARLRDMAGDDVRFAGVVPHEAIEQFLLAADVLVSTSESEAFGLSIAEALACGCAVVTADIPGPVRELVTPATGRRVPVGDVDAFVDALASLGDVRALGRGGHDLVAYRFSEDAMLRRYARLIAGLRTGENRTWRVPETLLDAPHQLVLPPWPVRLRRLISR